MLLTMLALLVVFAVGIDMVLVAVEPLVNSEALQSLTLIETGGEAVAVTMLLLAALYAWRTPAGS